MRKFILAAIGMGLVVTAAIATGYFADQKSPHNFTDNDCFSCHFTIPREGDTAPMRFMDTISNLCGRCHDMSGSVSHRVNFVPPVNMAIPKDMPLDEHGQITCITCHDVHKEYINSLTNERTHFLRREPAGKTFCMACHTSDTGLGQISLAPDATSHRPAMDKGHGFAHFEVLDPSTGLDALSLGCLDCHNDPGSTTKTTLGAGVWRHAKEGIGLSHPIGIDYYGATCSNKDLVSVKDLDHRLKLFDGKMGCCTCHDPYAPGDGQGLVIGARNAYQDLCLSCHIK